MVYYFLVLSASFLFTYMFYFDYPLITSLTLFIVLMATIGLTLNKKRNKKYKFLVEDAFKDIKNFHFPKTNETIVDGVWVIIIAIFTGVLVMFLDNGLRILFNF
jgi:preprotein translocase subunit SecE